MGGGVQGWGGGGSGRVVLIDNGRVYQSKAADALVQVKTTKFGTNVGLNMLLNISSRYLGGLFWSRQLRGLPSSDGYFFWSVSQFQKSSIYNGGCYKLGFWLCWLEIWHQSLLCMLSIETWLCVLLLAIIQGRKSGQTAVRAMFLSNYQLPTQALSWTEVLGMAHCWLQLFIQWKSQHID